MVATTRSFERPLTIEDLERMPNDGRRYELLQGELIVLPTPDTQHQRLHLRLFRLLDAAVIQDRIGEVFTAPYDVKLSRHDVVQPDLLVVGNEQSDQVTPLRFEGVPTLAIEITLPSTAHIDRVRKAALYERSGVAEFWIVEPEHERIVIQHVTESGSMTEIISTGNARSNVVPSFVVNLPELFRREAE